MLAGASVDAWEYEEEDCFPVKKSVFAPPAFHPLYACWDEIATAIVMLLDATEPTSFVSVDLARIGRNKDDAPLIVWIGVHAGSLENAQARSIVASCEGMLDDHNIQGVEVEVRETAVEQLATLFDPSTIDKGIAKFAEPLTTCVGIPLTSSANPQSNGTGAVFVQDLDRPDVPLACCSPRSTS